MIGYQKVNVREYIPLPLRCNKCFMFNHISNACRNNKLCNNWGQEYHLDPNTNDKCTRPAHCVDCKENQTADRHNSVNRSFTTTKKCDNKTALSILRSRYTVTTPHSYASLTKTSYHTHPNPTPQQNTGPQHLKGPNHTQQGPTTSRSTPTSYAGPTNTDNNLDKQNLTQPPKPSTNTVQILPLTTSKRMITDLKAAAKTTTKKPKKTQLRLRMLLVTHAIWKLIEIPITLTNLD